MKCSNRKVIVLVMAALMLFSGMALAQDKLTQAREHYARGQAFYKQKQYDLALRELMEAYKLDPNPVLVFNIARVHEDRRDYYNAIKYYESYVLMVKKRRARNKAKRKIRKLKKLLKKQPKLGYLTIQTTPPGAIVRVDGREVGKSPLAAKALTAGRHSLEILLAHFETHRAQLLIMGGQTTQINFQLREMPGTIFLSTVPAGAEATVFGAQPRKLGRCPCVFQAAAGRYKVQVSKPGFQAKNVEFVKVGGQQLRLNVTLDQLSTTGALFVNSAVSGAQIRVDGTTVGSTPLNNEIKLAPGRKSVVVSAPGYQSWTAIVEIQLGQLTQVNASLVPVNNVNIGNPQPYPTPVAVNRVAAPSSGQSTLGWVFLWSGIATTAAAGGTTAWMLLERRNFQNSTNYKLISGTLARNDLTRVQALELVDRIKLLETLSYSLGGVGVAAVITGIVLIATDDGEAPTTGRSDTYFSVIPFSQGGMMNFQTRF